MVFSEWQLDIDSARAIALETKAKRLDVRNIVGLQGRFAPEVQHTRRLVEEGYIGDVLSTALVGSAFSYGGVTTNSKPLAS